jgi:hypothetical protein
MRVSKLQFFFSHIFFFKKKSEKLWFIIVRGNYIFPPW